MKIHRIFTIFIMIIITMFIAGAEPKMPNVFYGDVIIGGSPAPDGAAVTAEIGGTELVSTTTTVGAYSLSVPADDPVTPENEGGVNNDVVDFFVNGIPAGNGVFKIGNITQVNLEIDGSCTQTNGGVEICDGVDNDCDGSIDEDLTRATTCGVGACAGNTGEETCTAGSWSGDTCDAFAGAIPEICDGLDNNCDGSIDETFPTLGDACSVGIGACHADGNLVCTAEGDSVICDALEGTPGDENTNCHDNVDNDCNGLIDGDDPVCQECSENQTLACLKQEGVCAGSIQGCLDGEWPGCDYSLYNESYEEIETTCDHLDNDCDGEIDEGCECVTDDIRTCGTDIGECQAGTETCVDDLWSGVCDGSVGPSTEVCNDGLDNDCDNLTDCDDLDCLGAPGCVTFETSCVDGIDNDDDGYIDCNDSDCAEDANCVHTEFCLVNRDVELLDVDFNPVDSINDGELYNIRVTSWNRCADAVEAMHIVQIEDDVDTPINIGTITTTIQPDEEQTYTVGFTMNSGAGSYTAMIFNWNHWVSQSGWEALSVPSQLDFTVN